MQTLHQPRWITLVLPRLKSVIMFRWFHNDTEYYISCNSGLLPIDRNWLQWKKLIYFTSLIKMFSILYLYLIFLVTNICLSGDVMWHFAWPLAWSELNCICFVICKEKLINEAQIENQFYKQEIYELDSL